MSLAEQSTKSRMTYHQILPGSLHTTRHFTRKTDEEKPTDARDRNNLGVLFERGRNRVAPLCALGKADASLGNRLSLPFEREFSFVMVYFFLPGQRATWP